MLEELISIHREVMSKISKDVKRYLFDKINWSAQAICILGDRGVGKTTLLCQYLLQEYVSVEKALYISADNINVTARGLYKIAKEYISQGGEALFIDEIHKYPNWSVELKNIIDTYKNCKIVFSASSSLDLKKSKADLSRRVVYYTLSGLSFREFLLMGSKFKIQAFTLEEIIHNHVSIAEQLSNFKPLKLFKTYLEHGYYPFFMEGIEDYLSKLNNVIEKVIFEDIAVVFNLKQTTLPILKKLLWLVATTPGLTPNIDNISSSLGVSREVIYNCFEYLAQAGLLHNLYHSNEGIRMLRKPGKVYLQNTNLLYAINGMLKRGSEAGTTHETFFVNQVGKNHQIILHRSADFFIDERYVIEVGGGNKKNHQIKDLSSAFLAVDDVEIGYKQKIPLYLFGLLY